jgi:hypothetical protein
MEDTRNDNETKTASISSPDTLIRDRIKEFRRVPAGELLDHTGNPRRHPQAQRDALRGVLEQVGIAAALVAYHSERNGGRLTLIDGHLRKQDHDLDWPTLILDVTDEEADFLLATHDPLAALAEYDKDKLDALLQEVKSPNSAVQQMLADLAKKAGLQPPNLAPDQTGELKEQFQVLVQCDSEDQQAGLLERLTEECYQCRSLIS